MTTIDIIYVPIRSLAGGLALTAAFILGVGLYFVCLRYMTGHWPWQ